MSNSISLQSLERIVADPPNSNAIERIEGELVVPVGYIDIEGGRIEFYAAIGPKVIVYQVHTFPYGYEDLVSGFYRHAGDPKKICTIDGKLLPDDFDTWPDGVKAALRHYYRTGETGSFMIRNGAVRPPTMMEKFMRWIGLMQPDIDMWKCGDDVFIFHRDAIYSALSREEVAEIVTQYLKEE